MAEIVLLRHGETEWSRTGRHTGHTDIPLTEYGRTRARAVRPLLEDRSFGLALESPLSRARETAQLAGVPDPEVDHDLIEWDYGAWEGRRTVDIRHDLSDPGWLIWDDPIPAGDSPGEQLTDVAARVTRVIERCVPVLENDEDCILVAHGHVLRILTATWLGLAAHEGRLFALDPGGLSSLGFEHQQRVIRSWNVHPVD